VGLRAGFRVWSSEIWERSDELTVAGLEFGVSGFGFEKRAKG